MIKKVRKLFFVWNESEEKEFLEDMARKGYMLKTVGFGGYTFETSEPKKMIFQFDFRGLNKISEKEYLQIFEDSGWTFVSRLGAWYYFSKERTEEEVDCSIFSDNESKRAKYKRIILFLFLTGFPLYYQTFFLFPNLTASKLEFPSFYFFFRIIVYIFTVLHILAVLKIISIYRKNKSHMKE